MLVLGDDKADAAAELSPLHGHFEARYPAMDQLVRMFQPSRTWIEQEYTDQ